MFWIYLKIGKKNVKKDNSIENTDINSNDFSYILNDCISLDDDVDGIIKTKYHNILKEFYEKRKIDKDIKFYIAYKGEYKNRIIIPIYDNNKLVFFQGRAINDQMLIKYKNPSSPKHNIIFNRNNFEKNKYIVITEGILDALSIKNQATVCLGAFISDDFLKKLFEYTDRGIIISLDNDETGIKSMITLMKESNYKNKLKYFVMPKRYNKIKDLNELKVKENIEDIYEFVVNNSHDLLKANVLLKM